MTADPFLSVRDLVTEYRPRLSGARRDARVRAVDGVTFDLARGEALGVVGESGCGKSTLARTILRLVPATAGRVIFEGRDVLALRGRELRTLRRSAQIVFQNPFDSLDPRMRILSIVREPLDIHEPRLPRAERDTRALALLAEVGLTADLARHFPHQLSGGQRQRVGIARALATGPSLLVCDEPVSSLDTSVQAQVLTLLETLRARRGLSLLFISHDLRVVRYLCDRALVMYRGRIVELAPVDVLVRKPLHPYTRLLLSSVPSLDPRARPTLGAGEAVAREAPPATGCAFFPRCPEAEPRCLEERPPLVEVAPGHQVACPRAEAMSGRGAT